MIWPDRLKENFGVVLSGRITFRLKGCQECHYEKRNQEMKKKLRITKHALFGILLMLPGFLVILLLKMYPILEGISYSFTNRRMDRPIDSVKFIGLENFIEVFQDEKVLRTVWFTLVYAFFIVLISYVLGLLIAMLLNRNIRGRGIYRSLILLPWVISNTVTAANFRWILNDRYGIVNRMLIRLGLIDQPIQFFADIDMARLMVIGVGIWKTIPFMVIVILAALQSIPMDYYEAAQIDGASFFARFRYITLPGIKAVTVMATTLQFIWNFNNFESIWLLTSGGPVEATQTLAVKIYEEAFLSNRIGYSAAIAVVIMLFMMLFTLIRFRLNAKASEDS